MARLRKKVFWDFVVSLPEDGDVAGMQAILDQFPNHREELLHGTSPGVDDGVYSALNYATWLCQFENHRSAREVVRWLLERGLPADIWTALALEDATRVPGRACRRPGAGRGQAPAVPAADPGDGVRSLAPDPHRARRRCK